MTGHSSWAQMRRRREEAGRHAREHPVQARIAEARARLFGTFGFFRYQLRPRRLARQVRWFFQRGRRGWSERDVWSLDSYIARVLSQALVCLAEQGHAYPGDGSQWETPEKWHDHLLDLAARCGAWNSGTFTDKDMFEVTRAAVEEFGRNFGVYWD